MEATLIVLLIASLFFLFNALIAAFAEKYQLPSWLLPARYYDRD